MERTLWEYVRYLQGEDVLPFQLEIQLCSQLNSCFLDQKHCTIDSRSLDCLNNNGRMMEQILLPNVVVCIAEQKYISKSLEFIHCQRTLQVAVGN